MGKALGGARIAPTVVGATLAAITVALALSGCVSADPKVTPQPHASATPLFATDAEALTAAEEAYAAYLKVSDQILADGGANPERILTVATEKASKLELEGFATFASKRYKSTGSTLFDHATLQAYSPLAAEGRVIVSIYVCQDVGNVDVFDESGVSVVSPTRPSRTAFEVGFNLSEKEAALMVSSNDVWEGNEYCES
jgi:hypothetical protein